MTDRPAPRSSLLFRRWTFKGARPYHGGATTDPRTGERQEPTEGYGVGVTENTTAKARTTGPHRVAHEKAAQQRLARRHGTTIQSGYVGSWREGTRIHYDPSLVVTDKDEAIQTAKSHNQKAIWDFGNKREIRIEHDGS